MAGFEKRYGVPVTVVDGPELLPYVPLGNFVDGAEALGLPATRESAVDTLATTAK